MVAADMRVRRIRLRYGYDGQASAARLPLSRQPLAGERIHVV
jgi:hypothetical protein